jgi:hypothetical protein
MKTFKQFLMESVRTYKYKIKVCGDTEKNWMDMFIYNLKKFDPVKIGEPKSTPIQKDPRDFPHAKNQPVTIIDVEFKYPCTEPMVKQVARLLNYDENMVCMKGAEHEESLEAEAEQYANQASHSPVLTHEELEDSGKEASKEYGEQYMSRIRKSYEEDKMDMSYAAPKTKPAEDMRTKPGNNKSPMTQITRQPKPETGASAGAKFR